MKNTAPLSTPTRAGRGPRSPRRPPRRARAIRSARASRSTSTSATTALELGLQLTLPSARLPRRPRRYLATATTSSPRTTSGQALALRARHLRIHEQVLHLHASFRPAGRRPASRARRGRAARDSIVQAPQRTAPLAPLVLLQPHLVVLAHRPDAGAEVDPLRPLTRASNSANGVSRAWGRRRRSAPARACCVAAGVEARAAAGSRRGSGPAPCPDSTCLIAVLEPFARQYASVSSRQTSSSGRTTPSSRAPRSRAGARSRRAGSSTVSTWSDAVWPVARRPRRSRPVAELAQLRLRLGPRRLRRRRRRAPRAQKRASSSDSSPRRPWLTCTAETR